jgi:hypothetical protein
MAKSPARDEIAQVIASHRRCSLGKSIKALNKDRTITVDFVCDGCETVIGEIEGDSFDDAAWHLDVWDEPALRQHQAEMVIQYLLGGDE